MEQYLLTIEFRYVDVPKYEGDSEQYITKIITLGVFTTRDEANATGNKAMEVFEKYFKLNEHYNKKERFSNNRGCFGNPNDLISNLAYLKTPFEFYAKITVLKFEDVEQTIVNAIEATKRYKEFKSRE